MKQIILIEYRNNKHSYREQTEHIAPNFFIKQWKFARITEERLDELKNATTDQVEYILKNLYYEA